MKKYKKTEKTEVSEPSVAYGFETTTNWDIIGILDTVFDSSYFNNLWQKVKAIGFNKSQYSNILNILSIFIPLRYHR